MPDRRLPAADGLDSAIRPGVPAVPAAALLHTWTARDWSNGIHVASLAALDRLTVTTRNSVYELVITASGSADVMVRGGAFFPSFTRARLSGSSLGGGLLKVGMICPGFCLELVRDDAPGAVVTTRVRSVLLQPSSDLVIG